MRRRTVVWGLLALGAAPVIGSCAAPARARVRRIGYLSGNIAAPGARPAFHRKLRELGWHGDQDVLVEYKESTSPADLRRMAQEFVSEGVDVIVASGGKAHAAAAAATRTVPIVVLRGPDPVLSGLADSHARPGRNVTGTGWDTTSEGPKKVQLLGEAVPGLRRVALLYRSDNTSITSAKAALDAAQTFGMEGELFGARSADEMDAVLERVAAGRFEGIVATSVLSVVRSHTTIPEAAARLRIPQIYGDIEIVRAGGLMHYGASFKLMDEEAATLVDKILKGADPAELPITLTTPRDFVINFGAAKRIGMIFPNGILRQATDVIR